MNKDKMLLYQEKINHQNELNRVNNLLKERQLLTDKQIASLEFSFATHWQWFTDHMIQIGTPQQTQPYKFTRSPEEKEYEEQLLRNQRTLKLEFSLNNKKRDLLATAEFLKDELERAISIMKSNNYQDLNPLGIVQSSGQKIDVLTAEVVMLHQFMQEKNQEKM